MVIGFSALLTAGFGQSTKLDLSEKALVARASAYVADYKKQFAFLVADEEYKQTLYLGDRHTQERLLRSEVFSTYLEADDEWIVVRDVGEVDGVRLADRADIRVLLSKKDALRGVAEQIAARNAQYNIGSVARNFNEPTLPLLLVDNKRAGRVKFDRRQVITAEDEATLAVLEFEERRDRPTLIHNSEGRSAVPAKGEIVVDAATGAIRRTVFALKVPGTTVRFETMYTRDARLNMWLPSRFTERYETTPRGARDVRDPRQLIECEATYTNYRRFEVKGRIVK
jgi:hypothetical protein